MIPLVIGLVGGYEGISGWKRSLGFSLVFGVARIVNIAHTAFYMLAAYCFYTLLTRTGLGLAASGAIAVAAVTLLSVVCYRLVIEPVREHEAAVLIATIALGLIFQELMLVAYGGSFLGIPSAVEGMALIQPTRQQPARHSLSRFPPVQAEQFILFNPAGFMMSRPS